MTPSAFRFRAETRQEERRFLLNALADVERGDVVAAFEFLERPGSSPSPAE